MKKNFTFLMIMIISFQLAFASSAENLLFRSRTQMARVELLFKQMLYVKNSIKNRQIIELCPEKLEGKNHFEELRSPIPTSEEVDDKIDELLASRGESEKQLFCGGYDKSDPFTAESSASGNGFAQKFCPKTIPGLEQYLFAYLEMMEKKGQSHQDVKYFIQREHALGRLADKAKENVLKILDNSSYRDEVKKELVYTYHEQVALPMRELTILMAQVKGEDIESDRFNDRLLSFDASLFPDLRNDDAKIKEKVKNADQKESLEFTDFGKLLLGRDAAEIYFLDHNVAEDGQVQFAYNEFKMLERTLGLIVRANTKSGYIKAIKLVIAKMMTTRLKVYDLLLGKKERTYSIPQSCGNIGDLYQNLTIRLQGSDSQTEVKSEAFENKARNENLIAYLSSMGLFFTDDFQNPSFNIETNAEEMGKINPTEVSTGKYDYFEDYQVAYYAKDGEERINHFEPWFSDAHFDLFVDYKKEEIKNLFRFHQPAYNSRQNKASPDEGKIFKDYDVFNEIVARGDDKADERASVDGGVAIISVDTNSIYTQYLNRIKREKKAERLVDLIDKDMKVELESKRFRPEFPSFHSGVVWRQWGLNVLVDVAQNNLDATRKSAAFKALQATCQIGGNSSRWDSKEISSFCSTEHFYQDGMMKRFLDLIIEFSPSMYLPLKDHSEIDREKYQFLGQVFRAFKKFKEETFQSVTEVNEYQFLSSQLEFARPWAMARLGYLLRLKELEQYYENHDVVWTRPNRRNRIQLSSGSACFQRNVKAEIERHIEAGKLLGLNLPHFPFHLQRFLKDKDERKKFWRKIFKEYEQDGKSIFSAKLNGRPALYYLDVVASKSFIDTEKTVDLLKELNLDLSSEALTSMEKEYESELSEKLDFYRDLWKFKGDDKKIEKAVEKWGALYGYNKAAKDALRIDIFTLDQQLKNPIIIDLAKKATFAQIEKTEQQLESLCSKDDENYQELLTLFQSTSKVQIELNKALGLQNPPEEITELLDSMDPEEKTDMFAALGAFGLIFGAMALSAFALEAGAGLVVSNLIGLMAGGGTSIQAFYIFPREVERTYVAKENASFVRDMEEIDLANEGSDDLVNRSWGWAAFEAVSVLPLIGIFGRSGSIALKADKEISKSLALNYQEHGLRKSLQLAKLSGKGAAQNRMILEAEHIAGVRDLGAEIMDSLPTWLADFASNVGNRTGLYQFTPHRLTKRELDNFFKSERGSVENLDGLLKEKSHLDDLLREGAISSGQHTKKLTKIVDKYRNTVTIDGKKTYIFRPKQVLAMNLGEIDDNIASSLHSYLRGDKGVLARNLQSFIAKLDKSIKKYPSKGKIWRFRYGHLDEVRDLIVETLKKLEKVEGEKEFYQFIRSNIEALTKIYIQVPFRKREALYMISLQGGPYTNGIAGKRIPYVGNLADGIILRRIFSARDVLINEFARQRAGDILGRGAHLASYSAFETVELLLKKSEQFMDSLSLEDQMRMMERQISIYRDIFSGVKPEIKRTFGVRLLSETRHQILQESYERSSAYRKLGGNFEEMAEGRYVVENLPDGRVVYQKANKGLDELALSEAEKNVGDVTFYSRQLHSKKGRAALAKQQDRKTIATLNDEQLFEILFFPKSAVDRALSRRMWESVDLRAVLNSPDLPVWNFEMIKKYENYHTQFALEEYVTSLRIKILRKKAGFIDVM